jgi:hypothetical protein
VTVVVLVGPTRSSSSKKSRYARPVDSAPRASSAPIAAGEGTTFGRSAAPGTASQTKAPICCPSASEYVDTPFNRSFV